MNTGRDIPELDRQGLRTFGLTTGGIVAVLFGLFFPWVLERPIPLWPFGILLALSGLALAAPMALKPIYQGWMRLGLLLGKITTPVLMGVVFFLVVTPTAIVLRLAGKDAMARRLSRSAGSYRIKSTATPPQRLEKPF